MKSLDYASTKAEVTTLRVENAALKARLATDVKVDVADMEAENTKLKAENTKLKASPAPVDNTKMKELEAENCDMLTKITLLNEKVDDYRKKAKKYYNKAKYLKQFGSKSVDTKKADPTAKAPKSAKSAADVLVSGMSGDKKRKLDTTKPSTAKPAVSAEEKKLAALAKRMKANATAARRRAEKRAEAEAKAETKLRVPTDDESATPTDSTTKKTPVKKTPTKKRKIVAVDSDSDTPETSEKEDGSETEDESEIFTEDESEHE